MMPFGTAMAIEALPLNEFLTKYGISGVGMELGRHGDLIDAREGWHVDWWVVRCADELYVVAQRHIWPDFSL